MSLRIVLMGTGEFALPTFRALMESDRHSVVGVFTQPDREGRGHHRHVNKVKELALQNDIPVFQPPRVNHPEVLSQLRDLQADVFVVAAYGQILKPELLAIPRLGAFNLHGSLLPRHRGAAPVQYSVWQGDRETGVTMFLIEPALDSGPMVGQVVTEIRPTETSGDLMTRLADLSVSLTETVLDQLEGGTAVLTTQNEAAVTLAPKISKEDGQIDWTQSASRIDCHVRAMQPWPKASATLCVDDRPPLRCILLECRVPDGSDNVSGTPGDITVRDRSLLVKTGSGILEVLKLQPEGRKPVDAMGFINGYGVKTGGRFTPQT